jgi:tetratricopeptide (TPR) repeat protein
LTAAVGAARSGDAASGVSDSILSVVAECEQLFAADDADRAKQRLLSLQSVTPVSEGEWKALHSLCLKLKDRTRAQLYTERFLVVCEDNAAAHLANARNYASAYRDRDRILEAVAAALRNPGSDAEFWREVARLQRDVQEHEAACVSARKAITSDPTDVEMRELLISSLGVLERTAEIRNECELLANCLSRANLNDPLRWASLARIAAEAGAKRRARSYIELTVGYLTGVDYGAEFELIRALILTSQHRRAKQHLEHLLGANSENIWLWTTLLEMAWARQYYDIALIAIARLKAIPYQDPEFYRRLDLQASVASKSSGTILEWFIRRWIRQIRV